MAREDIWRKSSRSENGPNCVEVRNTFDQLRDSKNLAGSPLRANVPALLRTIQTGRLDR